MIEDIFEGCFKVIGVIFFKLFFEIIGFYTGEILLFVVTFGKKKPRWDYYAEENPSKFVILTEISVWIGLAFWISIGAAMVWIIPK